MRPFAEPCDRARLKFCALFLLILLLNAGCCLGATANLETVSDDELLNLIKTEKFVVTLFTKQNCEQCEQFESHLLGIREDLVDSMSAWVVKVVNSQMLRLYAPGKEPAVVFFRQGIPLLYDGPINEDEMFQTFSDNKEPVVKELTDDTFEHLTQASTGATTGDWFVMFYSTDCIDCQRLGARWEAVGAKLKRRMNIARINKYTTGAVTTRRFGVLEVPQFILFRQGKMYRYQIPKYDVKSFVSFANDWYKNAQAEKVPVPQSPFDDLVQLSVNFLKENPWVVKLGSMVVGVMVVVSGIVKLRKKTEIQQKMD